MKINFEAPDFKTGSVELRHENGEIQIYCSKKGLSQLLALCKGLAEKGQTDHLHLEDHTLLTKDSLPGVIALLD